MSNIVTLATLRELGVHGRHMRLPVAIGTLRYGLMLVGMAGHAGNLAMLGLAGSKLGIDRIMTGSTEFRRSVRFISEGQRLVCLVTRRAVLLRHSLGVRLMTLDTIRDVAVSVCVTEVTGEGLMLARSSGHLLGRPGVTGNADGLVLTGQVNVQRLVRVVATEAVVDCIVVGTIVTVVAARNVVFNLRTMAFVARLAIDFRLVGRPVRFDLGRLLIMALGTISNHQPGGENVSGRQNDKKSGSQNEGKKLRLMAMLHGWTSLKKYP